MRFHQFDRDALRTYGPALSLHALKLAVFAVVRDKLLQRAQHSPDYRIFATIADYPPCPGVLVYGHGLTITRVHAGGCCARHNARGQQ